jgi:hypothetical protein
MRKPSQQEVFVRNTLTSICLYNQSLEVKNDQYSKWINGELTDEDCKNPEVVDAMDQLICSFQSNMEEFEFPKAIN